MKFGQMTESYFKFFFKKNYAENVNSASYRPLFNFSKEFKNANLSGKLFCE